MVSLQSVRRGQGRIWYVLYYQGVRLEGVGGLVGVDLAWCVLSTAARRTYPDLDKTYPELILIGGSQSGRVL